MVSVKQSCRYCAYLPLTEAYLPLAECACRPAAPEWRKFACSRVPRQARGTTATPMWGLGAKRPVGSLSYGMWDLTYDILLSARNGMAFGHTICLCRSCQHRHSSRCVLVRACEVSLSGRLEWQAQTRCLSRRWMPRPLIAVMLGVSRLGRVMPF